MKIVHISSSATGGGAAIAALRLHQSLIKHPDIQSDFIQRFHIDDDFAKANNIQTANTSSDIITRIRKKFNKHTEHYHWVKLNKYPKNYEIATFATTSYRLEDLPIVKEADIIHLHWVAEFLNYPTFFKNIKQPIVWTLHDINPFKGMFHFESDRLKNIKEFGALDEKIKEIKIKAINQKDDIHVVYLSDWMKKQSLASPALQRYPYSIIPNGLDFLLYPSPNIEEGRRKLDVNNGLKNILVVGATLDNIQKGFPMFFEAVNKLDRNDFNLITVGHMSDRIQVKENINHIHIENISDVSELNTYYAAADITVIPSKEDNLPNTMLESFANGTPIMSFSNGGMAEHINTGNNGILINEIGIEPLVQSLNDFLNNKYTFDSEKIRDYAINHFSDTKQTEKYIQLYKELLSK
ncbi:MAG: glycosyltransferase [Prevotella sp.]|jgi:glycosyltransferase involved in cell wall biosynthesis|nr:glycosyltransferase [Prevotella sp.]